MTFSKPSPILLGEKRLSIGGRHTLTAYAILPTRVLWMSNKGLRSWNGISKWREFELVSPGQPMEVEHATQAT